MTLAKVQYKRFLEMCDAGNYENAEILIKDIIIDVLNEEGKELDIQRTSRTHNNSFDYIGNIKNGDYIENIVVDLKISKKKISADRISNLLTSAMIQDIKNVVLVSNSELTKKAKESVDAFSKKSGINFQVFGKDELDIWFESESQVSEFVNDRTIHSIIKNMSRELARQIANYPEKFMCIEWRDLERLIATIFSDFGYEVELTPCAKDGGKDVIVWYKGESYIIEIKHWNEKNKVGGRYISDFLKVVIRENRKSGLYLSSSGYTANAFETLSKIEKTKVRYGDKTSMLTLIKMYERMNNGIYIPMNGFESVLEKISQRIE